MDASGQPSPIEPGQASGLHPSPPQSRLRFVFFNQRGLRAGWRLLLYLLLPGSLMTLAYFARRVGAAASLPGGAISPTLVIVQEIILLFVFLTPALVMARVERRRLADYGLPLAPRAALGRNFWLGVLWGVLALTALLLVLRINGSFLFGRIQIGWREAVWYATLWALAFFLVGVAEEFMFRGYVQFTLTDGLGFLGRKTSFVVATAITSLLFAWAHTGNTGESFMGLGAVVAIGLFFAFTLWRTGTLWFAIGFHASWDWAQSFLYGVANSGIVAKGHLLNPTVQGPHWYSGGTVGPEGSALIFPLIVLLFFLFHRTFPKGSHYPALREQSTPPYPMEGSAPASL
jgi:CAAX protease family protein